MTNPTRPYFAFDLGSDMRGSTITLTVKTCKSGRHRYYGTTRCPACKKITDARYQNSVKDAAKGEWPK